MSYASSASLDLVEIIVFGIETWGEDAARVYADRLVATIDRLGEYPRLGHPAERIGRRVRQFSVGSHIAYYEIGEDAVMILRILHASRDPARHIP